MRRKVTPAPTGIWKQVARLQRVGLSEGMRGRGGTWLAMGIGAWGLQRLRGLAAKEDEILLREPLAPGETITVTNQTTTRAQARAAQEQAQAESARLQKQAKKAEKAAKKARKGLTRAERRQLEAQEARSSRRRRRRSP